MGVRPWHCSSLAEGLAWSGDRHWPMSSGASPHRAAKLGLLHCSQQEFWQAKRLQRAFAYGTSVLSMATFCAGLCLCWEEGLKAPPSPCTRPIPVGSPDGHESGAARILTPAPHGCPRASPRDYGRVEAQPRCEAPQEAELVPCLEVQADEPARAAEALPGESAAALR